MQDKALTFAVAGTILLVIFQHAGIFGGTRLSYAVRLIESTFTN
jgi:hypothetical protein